MMMMMMMMMMMIGEGYVNEDSNVNSDDSGVTMIMIYKFMMMTMMI